MAIKNPLSAEETWNRTVELLRNPKKIPGVFKEGALENRDALLKKIGAKGKNKSISVRAPVDQNGNPITLGSYQGITDAKGNLQGPYKLGDASPWMQMQLDKEAMMRGANMDSAVKGALSGTGQMQANLAMTGGLSSGARERIARSGARDLNLARQGVNLQSGVNRLGIQSDAFDKTQDASKYNIQNAILDKKAKEDRKLMQYQTDMQGWAAGKQSEAIAKSGKK